jgi:hypothetical protein
MRYDGIGRMEIAQSPSPAIDLGNNVRDINIVFFMYNVNNLRH